MVFMNKFINLKDITKSSLIHYLFNDYISNKNKYFKVYNTVYGSYGDETLKNNIFVANNGFKRMYFFAIEKHYVEFMTSYINNLRFNSYFINFDSVRLTTPILPGLYNKIYGTHCLHLEKKNCKFVILCSVYGFT